MTITAAAELDLEHTKRLLREIFDLPGKLHVQVLGAGFVHAARTLRDEIKRTDRFKDRTGKLRMSIRAVARSSSVFAINPATGRQVKRRVPSGRASLRVGFDEGAFYGVFIELGTSHIRARRFVSDAVEANVDRLGDLVLAGARSRFSRLQTSGLNRTEARLASL